ncbi:MAG: thioredoxin [Bacteroidales bacterium]|nr:thioredoxin [Bacteroidales bacterium]
MKKNILLAISFALGLTAMVSCNQTQANNETETNNKETVAQTEAPKEIEKLANDLMSDQTSTEAEKEKGEVVTLDEKNFSKAIAKGLVLVDFYATWCGPCKMQKPVLAEVAKDNADNLTVGTVDTDKCQNLSSRYNIRSIPCMILFENGKEVKRIIGYHDKQELMKELIGYIE